MMAERLLELVMRFVFLVIASVLISVSEVTSGWIILWVLVLLGVFYLIIRFGSHADEYLPRLSHWLGQFERIDEERIRDPLTKLGVGLKTGGFYTAYGPVLAHVAAHVELVLGLPRCHV